MNNIEKRQYISTALEDTFYENDFNKEIDRNLRHHIDALVFSIKKINILT